MIAALRHMFSLPAEQRALLKTKLIQGRYTAAELIAKLTPLARFDRIGDNGRKALTGWLVLAIVAIVALLIGAAVASDNHPALCRALLLAAAAVALTVPVFIVLLVLLRRLDDAENNLREVALPYLSALRQDVPEGAKLEVRIDFSRAIQKSKLERIDKPVRPGFVKLVNRYYVNPWFEGTAPLATGGRLQWLVTDHVCSSRRTRRNARGKYKIKTKSKKKSRLDVLLSLPARHYGAADPADPFVAADGRRVEVKLSHKLAPPVSAVVDGLIDLTALAFNKVKPLDKGATP